jgi:YrbI family 3-deoxy-D-manno-octulosonate 8-phosphate phosphatase
MNVAIIPLRKGSKGIPGKNKKKLLGRPLFSWTLYEAAKSKLDSVYIFTDDQEIIDYIENEYAWLNKVKTMKRSIESATDTASTETAMIEFVSKLDVQFDTLTLIQATSPLLTAEHINSSIDAVSKSDFDSTLTVSPFKRFFWSENGEALNYDFLSRPRRQELSNDYVENGACYTITSEYWNKQQNRLGGRIKPIIMPDDTLIEIDEPHDFLLIEQLLKSRLRKHKTKLIDPKLAIFDVDGVFTDASVIYTSAGENSKVFNMQDGMGIELLRKSGIHIAVMTSENSEIVKQRMTKLKIQNLFLGVKDKYARLDNLIQQLGITWNSVIYIGDDINDLTNINSAGFSICPSNAVPEIKRSADYILTKSGGNGAVREAAEYIIRLNNRNDC